MLAKRLDCRFALHHFSAADQKQLEAVLDGLNRRADVDGIVVQLPLPANIDTAALINQIAPTKDVDNLGGQTPYDSPTVAGILALLKHHQLDVSQLKTVILGAGRLVGAPLAKKFHQHHWPLTVVAKQARQQAALIRRHDLLIAATGVKHIVTPAMVHDQMIVIDGSGRDVDVTAIEPLVKTVTPAKGAIGPLTVSFLFENLLTAATRATSRPRA